MRVDVKEEYVVVQEVDATGTELRSPANEASEVLKRSMKPVLGVRCSVSGLAGVRGAALMGYI